jgi:leader peptidase (prepilin peptidase)/N-methyltransferase
LVGSFLNVVIHRLPLMMARDWLAEAGDLLSDDQLWPQVMGKPLPTGIAQTGQQVQAAVAGLAPLSLWRPRSRCPHCGHAIRWYDNIPVLSYLLLRRRCRDCGVAISARYPLVEALCAGLTVYAVWHFGLSVSALAAMLLVWSLVALTFIDYDTQLLPDDITLPLLWLGLLWNMQGGFVPLADAVLGAVAGYLLLWSVYHGFRLLTGKEGMGYGDFKLLAALGAWLGWLSLPLIVLASSVVGAVIGISLVVAAGHDRAHPIPFGPYLALGGIIALFWGEPIMRAYLGT